MPRGAHKIAQYRHVWLVGADSPRIYRKAKPFSKFQVYACIIKFRESETLRRQNTIPSRRVNGPRRTMCPPRAASHFVELLPIAFVPSRHAFSLDVLFNPLDAAGLQKVHRVPFLCLFPEPRAPYRRCLSQRL